MRTKFYFCACCRNASPLLGSSSSSGDHVCTLLEHHVKWSHPNGAFDNLLVTQLDASVTNPHYFQCQQFFSLYLLEMMCLFNIHFFLWFTCRSDNSFFFNFFPCVCSMYVYKLMWEGLRLVLGIFLSPSPNQTEFMDRGSLSIQLAPGIQNLSS